MDSTTKDKPFRLVTAPARNFLNSTFTETPGSQQAEKRPTVLIHAETCEALGLRNGDPVRIGNDRASVLLHTRVARHGMDPQTLIVESLWPNSAFAEGLGINALTSAEPAAPSGGAVFHDTAVWVQPA
jgi:anaerobic selenocysteine-containing dehydrogenase